MNLLTGHEGATKNIKNGALMGMGIYSSRGNQEDGAKLFHKFYNGNNLLGADEVIGYRRIVTSHGFNKKESGLVLELTKAHITIGKETLTLYNVACLRFLGNKITEDFSCTGNTSDPREFENYVLTLLTNEYLLSIGIDPSQKACNQNRIIEGGFYSLISCQKSEDGHNYIATLYQFLGGKREILIGGDLDRYYVDRTNMEAKKGEFTILPNASFINKHIFGNREYLQLQYDVCFRGDNPEGKITHLMLTSQNPL